MVATSAAKELRGAHGARRELDVHVLNGARPARAAELDGHGVARADGREGVHDADVLYLGGAVAQPRYGERLERGEVGALVHLLVVGRLAPAAGVEAGAVAARVLGARPHGVRFVLVVQAHDVRAPFPGVVLGHVGEKEKSLLKDVPFINLVGTQGANDPKAMYEAFGDKGYREELATQFKLEHSNFRIAIVVDMWITGFDVPSLTYMYNDKPLKKHMLIQTVSRVNRKYPGKDYGLIVDYIGIRDNMREAMKLYGGDHSVAPTADDVEQATLIFREELAILKKLFADYDLQPFLDPNSDPAERYKLLAKAAEYVFVSTEELNTEGKGGKNVHKVSFKTYFLKTVQRMRSAYDICQPSGELGEDESALAQCFMAIAGFVRKMSGTSELDADSMNRHVAKMVEEALKYNKVESILESGEEEDLFSPEYFEKLSSVKMPASKLELLIKMLRKQITEYGKTNQLAAKRFQEMLEETIRQYHERRKHLTAEEAGEAQERTSEEIIQSATEQALKILRDMNADRESFRKIGLTFEEKAFYDILMSLRDQYNFEYGEDKIVKGLKINEKCKSLAKKIKEIIDAKSSFADWLNNQIVRDQLKFDIKICLVKNGYPPQYSPEVFRKVMEQVDNFKGHSEREAGGERPLDYGRLAGASQNGAWSEYVATKGDSKENADDGYDASK